jgi:hypothetical protein
MSIAGEMVPPRSTGQTRRAAADESPACRAASPAAADFVAADVWDGDVPEGTVQNEIRWQIERQMAGNLDLARHSVDAVDGDRTRTTSSSDFCVFFDWCVGTRKKYTIKVFPKLRLWAGSYWWSQWSRGWGVISPQKRGSNIYRLNNSRHTSLEWYESLVSTVKDGNRRWNSLL